MLLLCIIHWFTVWVHVSFYYIVDGLSHLLIVLGSLSVHVNGGVFAVGLSDLHPPKSQMNAQYIDLVL